jgi:hypothetical protein
LNTAAQVAPRFAPHELPRSMRHLPLDHRGFPVPWFVQWFQHNRPCDPWTEGAEPNFVVMDERKRQLAIKGRRCWVCGGVMGKFLCFVAGPMCCVSRTSAEPPVHRDCGLFSAKSCPFLANPRMRRAEKLTPIDASAPGTMLTRNPGVTALWITLSYTPFEVRDSYLIHMGEPVSVLWFREGRAATRDEVMESVDSGMPLLRVEAYKEGADAVAELDRMYAAFPKYLPGGVLG